MDGYGNYIIENDPYNPTGSEKSTDSSGSSSYNPNVVYSKSDIDSTESIKDAKNIYSLENDGSIHNIPRDSEPWKHLFQDSVENIEKCELLQENAHWNDLFQRMLELEDSEDKSQKLATIAHDFVYCSDTYGKIIISELHLPVEKKTIKPVDVGGVAGGLKFKIQDIMFKFVIDTEIREGIWMYGDQERQDGLAQKSANHEIKGLNHCMEVVCNINGLIRFPLMAIIDYRGYRLLAISQLPIDKNTIVYGSCDAGKTVHNKDPVIAKEMEQIAKVLNLKGHVVGLSQTFIYGPGDIEVHKGHDGRYYMIDCARIFPPEYPLVVHNNRDSVGREIFYQMLRPELVAKSPEPLSSDAFSGWQTSIFDTSELNRDVIRVTKMLHLDIIKTSIININAKDEIDYSPTTHKVFEIQKSVNILHSQGINIRYLGIICSQITNKSIKELLLSEVVSRVWKRIIRSKLRKIMDLTKRPSGEPYKELIAEAFKMILSNSDENVKFWSSMEIGHFKDIALQIFPRCLSEEDKNITLDLRDTLDSRLVVIRIINLLNIKINPSSLDQFLSDDKDTYVLGLQDIEEVGSTVKYPYIIDLSLGSHLLNKSKEILKSSQTIPNPKEVERWICLTGDALYNASRHMPKAPSVVFKLLNAIHIKASFTSDPLKAVRVLIVGVINYSLHLSNYQSDNAQACGLAGLFHLQLATIYMSHSDLSREFHDEIDDARTHLDKALTLDPNCLDEYINQVLPISNSKLSSIAFIKNSDNFYKRRVHQLLTLLYLLSKTPETSPIHKTFQGYFDQIIQIDNFEVLEHAEELFRQQIDIAVHGFFERFKHQLQSLSIRKMRMNQDIATSISQVNNLVSLGLSEIEFQEDPHFNQFFTNIFENCKKLNCIMIVSNRNIDDNTFEGLYHHFNRLKGLALCKTGVTDKTLIKIAPHLSNLKCLTLRNSKEITDESICKILESVSLLELKLDSVSQLTDKTGLAIIDHQPSLQHLTFLNCHSISKECIYQLLNSLKNLKSFEKPNCQLPHTYKIHLAAFSKLNPSKPWSDLIKIFD